MCILKEINLLKINLDEQKMLVILAFPLSILKTFRKAQQNGLFVIGFKWFF